jgi:predicted Zn-dependent protease
MAIVLSMDESKDKFIPLSQAPPGSWPSNTEPNDQQSSRDNQKKYRRLYLSALVILIVGGILASPGIYRWVKVKRAEILVRQIKNTTNNVVANENYLKVRAAYNLAPQSPVVLRAMADALLQMNQIYPARTLLSQLVTMPRATADDCKVYAELLLKHRDHATLIKWLEPHLNKKPVPSHILEIQSWLLLEQGKIQDAISVARNTQKNYPQTLSPGALTLAQLLLTDDKPEHHVEGRKILDRILEDPKSSNKLRIEAARTYSHLNDLSKEEGEEISRILSLNPHATPADQVRALQVQMRLGIRTQEQIIQDAQQLARRNTAALGSLADWLQQNGLHQAALDLLPIDLAKNDNTLLNMHLAILTRAGLWNQLSETLQKYSDFLHPWQALLHKVFIARHTGTPGQYREAWEELMRQLPREPAYIRAIGLAALELQEITHATQLFNRLTTHPYFAREAHSYLISLSERNDSIEDWLRTLQRAEPYFKNDSLYAMQVDYCHLMLNIDRHLAIPRILQAFNENPTSLVHRCLAALALLFDGKAQDGYQLLNIPEINWSNAQPRWLMVKACLQAASGDSIGGRITRAMINEKLLKLEEINLLNRYVSSVEPKTER